MKKITLAHGNGGKLMHGLIKDLFVKNLSNPFLNKMGDAALIDVKNKKLTYTTDSFVIKPIFFPGGDIGKLSVCGTVNDLCVSGARPRYLSCGMIVEDGFDYKDLEEITLSIKAACEKSGVDVVAGDFKVVEKGAVDKIFINTSGIGEVFSNAALGMDRVKPGDKVMINGNIGDHALAVLVAREELKFKSKIVSDCAPLNGLISSVICGDIKFMRDPTRGGLATTLNEISLECGCGISVNESDIPVSGSVKVLSEALGMDPLYLANEGKVLMIASARSASKILSRMKKHPLGKKSAIIGEVRDRKDKRVYLRTMIGTTRVLDMLQSDQLPRIC